MSTRRLVPVAAALFLLAATPQAGQAQTISLFPDQVPNGIETVSGEQYHQRFDISLTGTPVGQSRAFTITVPAEFAVVPNSVTATSDNSGASAF